MADMVTVIGSGLLALLGSWLGSAFGFKQFKRERLLERRLEWYRDMHRVLVSIDTQLGSLLLAAKRNELDRLSDLERASWNNREALNVVMSEAAMYGLGIPAKVDRVERSGERAG
jgi:hypothetical protein